MRIADCLTRGSLCLAILLAGAGGAPAQTAPATTSAATRPTADWPQFGGASRDFATSERIATTWPADGPKDLWRAEVGKGHAPVSVAGGRLVAMGYTGEGDTVWCLDAVSGRELWKHQYKAIARCKGEPGGGAFDGPHAAALIDGGKVYTLSRDGQVHCLALADGSVKWRRDLVADHKARLPECGFAGAPLMVDDKLVVSVGPHGTALDPATGETRWQSGPEMAGYASPVLAGSGTGRRLFFFGAKDLIAADPADGRKLWSFRWPTAYATNVTDPIVIGDAVFISAAYDRGCALVDAATGEARWQNKAISSHCSPIVQYKGHLYGFDSFIDAGKGALVCVEPVTGKQLWRKEKMAGQLIRADDKLVIVLISGHLVIAEADPASYRELARDRLLPAERCPVPPTLVGGRLYCRTGNGRLVCFDMSP